MKVIQIILFTLLSCGILACNNSSKESKAAEELKPGEIFSKHNVSSCPLQLVGVYQRQQFPGVQSKLELMKIQLLPSQILVATPVIDGAEIFRETLYADGMKKQISNLEPADYRISYCENFMIVSIGQSLGKIFRTELRALGNGITLSKADDAGNIVTIKYQKIRAKWDSAAKIYDGLGSK